MTLDVDALAALCSITPFDVLGDRALAQATDVEYVRLEAGQRLITAGELAQKVYVVLEGEVVATAPDGAADAPILATLGRDAIVGEIAVLTGGPRSATLTAATAVTAVAIAGPTFVAWLEDSPALTRQLTDMATSRLRATRLAGQLQRLFPGPGAAALGEVANQTEFVSLAAGEVLFKEGDPADAAYIVVTGRVRVLAVDEDGQWQQPIAEIGSGELVGELALLDDIQRSATVVAARDTQLARLPREQFESLVISRPEGMLAVTRTIVARLRDKRDDARRAHSDHASIGLVPLSPAVDLDGLAAQLISHLSSSISVARVTSRDLDRQLGVDGAAQACGGEPLELPLTRWLDEHETAHELMLLQGDAEVTPWTRRCIARVDHVVLVADASDVPDITELERALILERALPHQRVSLVLLHARDTDHPRGTAAWLDVRDVDDHHHVRDGHDGDLGRLARHLAGRAVWLVLGGGGAKGFAHLGVIRAMHEVGMPIDGVAGSSIGTTMAVLAAIETPLDDLVGETAKLFSRVLDYTIPISGMVTGRKIAAAAERAIGDRDIADAWLSFFCVSTNLTRSRVVVHRRGDFVRAVRASVAIPGVIPPVAMGEDLLVDGGVMNNLPVDVARRLNPTGTVIASDVAPKLGPRAKGDHGLAVRGGRVLARRLTPGMKAPPVPRLVPTLMRSLLAAAAENRDRQLEAGLADLHLAFELRGVGLLAFDEVAPVAERGYDESIEAIRTFVADWRATAGSGPAQA